MLVQEPGEPNSTELAGFVQGPVQRSLVPGNSAVVYFQRAKDFVMRIIILFGTVTPQSGLVVPLLFFRALNNQKIDNIVLI